MVNKASENQTVLFYLKIELPFILGGTH